jgi:hypothetical protein
MIRNKQSPKDIVIDLTGPQGNAYSLLAVANQYGRLLGLDTTSILDDMQSGDYEHLIQVFDKNLGDFIILER